MHWSEQNKQLKNNSSLRCGLTYCKVRKYSKINKFINKKFKVTSVSIYDIDWSIKIK